MIDPYREQSRDQSKSVCRPLSGRWRFETRWRCAVVRLFFEKRNEREMIPWLVVMTELDGVCPVVEKEEHGGGEFDFGDLI